MALSKFCIEIAYVRRMRGHLIDRRLYNPGRKEIKRETERDRENERERENKREEERERDRNRSRKSEKERERERKVPCSNYIYASQMPPRCLRDSGSPSPVGKSKF